MSGSSSVRADASTVCNVLYLTSRPATSSHPYSELVWKGVCSSCSREARSCRLHSGFQRIPILVTVPLNKQTQNFASPLVPPMNKGQRDQQEGGEPNNKKEGTAQ